MVQSPLFSFALQVGELFHCADAFITLVTVSSDCAKPMQLPFQLQPVNDVDKLRQEVRTLIHGLYLQPVN